MRVVHSLWSVVSKIVVCIAPGTVLFALCFSAAAQQPAKIPRIGFLGATTASVESTRIEAFRQGMRELGYVEGKSIVIEWRWAEGKFDRLPELAAELVRLKVEVIVTGGSTSSGAAKKVTTTVPIVMAQDNDPVGSGFVASLGRPGGNMTGLATLAPEISGKQLELLKGDRSQALPRGRPRDFDRPGQRRSVKRDGTFRKGVQDTASIPRHTSSQRY